VFGYGAHDAVADEQIADPLLDGPPLRIIRIQVGVDQRLAFDRVHSHTGLDGPGADQVPTAM
jgi:hypothetical protein